MDSSLSSTRSVRRSNADLARRADQVAGLTDLLEFGVDPELTTVITKHSKEIDLLKRELDEKNAAILRLQKDMKELREDNKELNVTLEFKNKEIKVLKDEINTLESEKKDLQRKLRAVEVELGAVKEQIDQLKTANKATEDKNAGLEEEVKKLSTEMERIKKSLGPSETRLLYLGQMCSQIEAMMYQVVHPDWYEENIGLKVKHIEEDINELKENEKEEAEQRWEALKKTLKWNKRKHLRAMQSIQRSRNAASHPDLTEELLASAAKGLEGEGKLKCRLSCAKELIGMWKTLLMMNQSE